VGDKINMSYAYTGILYYRIASNYSWSCIIAWSHLVAHWVDNYIINLLATTWKPAYNFNRHHLLSTEAFVVIPGIDHEIIVIFNEQ